MPGYLFDPELSLEQNIEKSIEQADNEPIEIPGLLVETPAQMDTKLETIFESDEDKSPFDGFNTVSGNDLKQLLGEPMVSSINGFFVEIDTCMSVERCIPIGQNTTSCYELLTTKNAFKADGIAPFTTKIVGLSPLVAARINLILTFEGRINNNQQKQYFFRYNKFRKPFGQSHCHSTSDHHQHKSSSRG